LSTRRFFWLSPKFTLYKYVKLGDGSWRCKEAAFYSNGKIKPDVAVACKNAQGKPSEELRAEGIEDRERAGAVRHRVPCGRRSYRSDYYYRRKARS
jgi:hypothetical protein